MSCVFAKPLAASVILFSIISFPAQGQDRINPDITRAPRAVGDAPNLIYRIAGVSNTLGTTQNTGIATSFQCSSFSPDKERVFIVIRNFNGTVKVDTSYDIRSNHTVTASTKRIVTITDDIDLQAGEVEQGQAMIRATTEKIVCSAMVVDAAASHPEGYALHMVRFNPIQGSQE